MKIDRGIVYWKYGGRCAYCGIGISPKNMQVDHIKPKCAGGTDDIENLNPSCKYCNNHKLHSGIELWRRYLKSLLNTDYQDRLFRSRTKMRISIQFGAVSMKEWDGLFYFEKIGK